jgi:predicted GIY-YIG superfamily endonuclease
MPKVPNYQPPNQIELAKHRAEWANIKSEVNLHRRLHELNDQIKLLKIEQRGVVKALKEKNAIKRTRALQPVSLYALELEHACWYVGMSFNPEKRFSKHVKGKGAAWTRLHKPLRIVEVRLTEFFDQDDVARLEDDMTIEYALKYGKDSVRGGGFCQTRPYWPDVVLQNETYTG